MGPKTQSGKAALVRLPIRFSVTTISVMGRSIGCFVARPAATKQIYTTTSGCEWLWVILRGRNGLRSNYSVATWGPRQIR